MSGTVRMASQPLKGVPSSVSPVTHASMSPNAIPVSSIRKCAIRSVKPSPFKSSKCGPWL